MGWGIHALVLQVFKGFGKYDIEYMRPNWLTQSWQEVRQILVSSLW